MIQLSNTSLILDGLLDLRGVRKPLLEFYRQSRVDSDPDANAYVEISRDGGFTWVRDDASLRQNLTLSDGSVITANSTTNWSDKRTTWELRRHGLTGNIGYTVALRWRLQVGATEAQLVMGCEAVGSSGSVGVRSKCDVGGIQTRCSIEPLVKDVVIGVAT